jgi:hypothetical protein
MDEEEELENTLIGQQEEAPAMDTGDALMGKPSFLPYADDVAPSRVNALSVFTPGGDLKPGIDVNAITPSPTTLPAPSAVNDALPQASEQLPQALPAVATDQPQAVVSPFLQSPDTPSGLGGPLLRGFEMVNDAARGPNAPMGQEATRARLGGMTLNEYLNAPAGTPGVSGLRTDPQGRMITPAAPATVNNFAPQTPSVRATPAPFPDTGRGEIRDMLFRGPPSARPLPNDPQGFGTRPLPNDLASTRPNVDPGFIQQPSLRDPDEGFTPRPPSLREPDAGFIRPAPNLSDFERDSLARQIAIGGTGSFAGDSAAREARIAARPSFNEVRRDSDGRGGQLSQADLRDLAQGTDPNASEGQRMRALEIQQRAGLGQFKPEREPTELEKREIESRIRARDAQIKTAQAEQNRPEFAGKVYTVNGVTFAQTSRGGAQVIDTGSETPEQSTAQIQNFEFTLDQIDKAREAYSAGDVARANDILTAAGIQKNGIDVTANEYFGDFTPPPPPGSTPQVTDTQFDPSQLTGQDREAYNFAINNPNDERSQRILNKLGAN